MTRTTYAIGLGSNRWSRWGDPCRTLDVAVAALGAEDIEVVARSPTIATPAMGGAGRRFANAVVLVETALSPSDLMRTLQQIEHAFGRRPGRRWGPRVLDLDILLWSGSPPGTAGLRPACGRDARAPRLPHPGLVSRLFVLTPLATLAPDWRVPPTGRTVRHLLARLHAR